MADAEAVLGDQYEKVDAALAGGEDGMREPLNVLAQMRTQVLYHAVRDELDDGDAIADAANARLRDLVTSVSAAGAGDAGAVEQLRSELADLRKEDEEVLARLRSEGADLDALGEQMEVFAD